MRAALLLGLLACGYAPVRRQAAHGVRVAAVKNDTAQAEAGGLFASALRSELAGRGRLEPDGAASPELVLEIVALVNTPTSSAGEGAASFHLDADLKVTAAGFEDRFHSAEDYLAAMDVLGTEGSRRAALRRLARNAAREAVERYDISERLKN